MTPHISVLGLLVLTVALTTASPTAPHTSLSTGFTGFSACEHLPPDSRSVAAISRSSSLLALSECVSAFVSLELQPDDSSSITIKKSACDDIISALKAHENFFEAHEYREAREKFFGRTPFAGINDLSQTKELISSMGSYCAKYQPDSNTSPIKKGSSSDGIPNEILQRIVGIKAILRAPHVYVPKETKEETVGLALILAAAVLDRSASHSQASTEKTELLNVSQKFLNVSTKKESVKVLRRFKKSYPGINKSIIKSAEESAEESKTNTSLCTVLEACGIGYIYTHLTAVEDFYPFGTIMSLKKMMETAETKARKAEAKAGKRKSRKRSL